MIKQWYTLEEIKQKIAIHEYGAEHLLQHAMHLLEDHQQAIQSAVMAALEAAKNVADGHTYGPCGQYDYSYDDSRMAADDRAEMISKDIESIDPSTIVQSVMQEQALQTLADQAQELDMGYGDKK